MTVKVAVTPCNRVIWIMMPDGGDDRGDDDDDHDDRDVAGSDADDEGLGVTLVM